MGLNVDVPRLLHCLRINDARPRGNEWWARCPLPGHHENDASWSIRDEPGSPGHGWHKCFGCKKGGSVVDLVQRRIGITRSSAYRWLHEQGLVMGRSMGAIPDLKVVVNTPNRSRLSLPSTVRFAPLNRWPKMAQDYLKGRKVTARQVFRFKIGYAAQGRLAGRIVLPAYDRFGNVTNYTARSYVGSKRYLNPNKEDGWPIHLSIFGEHLWVGLPEDVAFTTEGSFNALAVDNVMQGEYAVGALYGSDITPQQVLKLSRFSTIVHVGDPDPTGKDFSLVLRDALRSSKTDVRIVIPNGGDANDVYKKHPNRLLEVLHGALAKQ